MQLMQLVFVFGTRVICFVFVFAELFDFMIEIEKKYYVKTITLQNLSIKTG